MGRWLRILALLVVGCRPNWVRTYRLDFQTLNDGNRLLSIEGTTNLPTQAPLEAVLTDNYGRQLARSQASVTPRANFSMVLDISAAPGGVPLTLEVRYDPQHAPVHVMARTAPGTSAAVRLFPVPVSMPL